jgi:hypothetical protein
LANLPENLVTEVRDFAEFLYQKQQRKAASWRQLLSSSSGTSSNL